MKIVFTGASSFTGYWFVRKLAEKGHEIYATFQKGKEEYEGVRRERVEGALPYCTPLFNCTFGSDHFLDTLMSIGKIDRLCHHASDVNDYKNPTFNVLKAVENNTFQLRSVLAALKKRGVGKVVLTGSFTEQNEGIGSEPLHAFSPYGLSKGMTFDVFQFETHWQNIPLAKFVIPTPFGPYEEQRFTSYLIANWLENRKPTVTYPDYVRDYVPAPLLAESYAEFALKPPTEALERCSPSFFSESNKAFTERIALKMRPRFGLPCEYNLLEQNTFQEPKERKNTGPIDPARYHWDEEKYWDEYAGHYMKRFSLCKSAS